MDRMVKTPWFVAMLFRTALDSGEMFSTTRILWIDERGAVVDGPCRALGQVDSVEMPSLRESGPRPPTDVWERRLGFLPPVLPPEARDEEGWTFPKFRIEGSQDVFLWSVGARRAGCGLG